MRPNILIHWKGGASEPVASIVGVISVGGIKRPTQVFQSEHFLFICAVSSDSAVTHKFVDKSKYRSRSLVNSAAEDAIGLFKDDPNGFLQ
ncbi:MAG: hypothetical protein U1E81_09655 [Xanthobacteraceae bacterium]